MTFCLHVSEPNVHQSALPVEKSINHLIFLRVQIVVQGLNQLYNKRKEEWETLKENVDKTKTFWENAYNVDQRKSMRTLQFLQRLDSFFMGFFTDFLRAKQLFGN